MFFSRQYTDYQGLRNDVEGLRQRLLDHPIYTETDSVERLRAFMSVHVFAVWDFMSLAKRLQREFTTTELPWMPPAEPMLARFANEVILTEESDRALDGTPKSHLEMYLDAMEEVGASTLQFRHFMGELTDGETLETALAHAEVPRFVRKFVKENITCAQCAPATGVMSSFLFGREDLIPDMFERLLPLWDGAETSVPHFTYYLKRHIELDGDEHGPIAQAALANLAGRNQRAWREAGRAAKRALRARIDLWDGVCKAYEALEPRRRRGKHVPRLRFAATPTPLPVAVKGAARSLNNSM